MTVTIEKAENPMVFNPTEHKEVTFDTAAQPVNFGTASNNQGKVSYTITADSYFSINPSSAKVTVNASTPVKYDGPNVTVYNINITARAEGNGNYNSKEISKNVTLKIEPYDINGSTIDLAYEDHAYIGTIVHPGYTVTALNVNLVKGTDFTESWNGKEPSKDGSFNSVQKLTITGKGNYTGTKEATYTETRKMFNLTINHVVSLGDGRNVSGSNSSSIKRDESTNLNIGKYYITFENNEDHSLSKKDIST